MKKLSHEGIEIEIPNFQLAIAGKPHGFHPGLATGHTVLPLEMVMEKTEASGHDLMIHYRHESMQLVVQVFMQFIPDTAVIRHVTKVKNEGDVPVTLTHLSSAYMQGIAAEGCMPWHDTDKIKVFYCRQAWEGEGQWRSSDLEEMGLYPTSVHPTSQAIHITSEGSWSTGRFLPMAVIEDKDTNKVWFVQIETSSHWHLEIGHKGCWDYESNGSLYIQADGASEHFGGWTKTLIPGESFDSVPAAIGCCDGNFTDAIRELTKYRRSILKPRNTWTGHLPVVFNDYMNCLWADPTDDKLFPLIDSAADVGTECFCMDAGWFSNRNVPWGASLGDWEPSADRFGSGGLQHMINYILSKGMIPGLWLEVEVCGENSALGKKPDSWFLRRNGKRVGGGERWFLNFMNPEVCQYIHAVIDRLVDMGIGFIKNDYNACIGAGDDSHGCSPADGLLRHIRAFYSFLDEVREKHPRLMIENCASGGMRIDYGILSHVHMTSLSDQEIYTNYPSIIGGVLAGVLPEQAGIWAYPYPLLFKDRGNPALVTSLDYQQSMEDGEQTIFNMVNGLCGNMYISGRLNAADAYNRSLVREAVSLYKQERNHIHNAFPIWPLGFSRISDRRSWASVGLVREDQSRILLAVWRLESEEEFSKLFLHGWKGRLAVVKQLFPSEPSSHVQTHYNALDGTLTVRLTKRNQARYFEIREI